MQFASTEEDIVAALWRADECDGRTIALYTAGRSGLGHTRLDTKVREVFTIRLGPFPC